MKHHHHRNVLALAAFTLVLTASAYSNYVVSDSSPAGAETQFGRAMRGSQLTVADVDEIALLLEALPRFAQHVPSSD